MSRLDIRAIGELFQLFAVVALLLFLPAGTLDFWQAWAYLAVFFGTAIAVTRYLEVHDPDLLERRRRGGPTAETERTQKLIMALATAGSVAMVVIAGLDRRFGWSSVPPAVSLASDIAFLLGYALIFLVFRVNSFAAATIALAPDQTVISTGPYAIVRHPMYLGGLVIIGATPVALGSWWAALCLVPLLAVFIWRLLDEEAFLRQNLQGYDGYCQSVRFRLVPYLW